MSELPYSATTPVSVGRVGLRARNAEALAGYYRDMVGLTELARSNGTISLGAGERALLEIEADPAARPDDPRGAGLFHTAFLLPTRADLGRWVNHAIEKRIPIDGASDHLVSEALYLTDPEGNGIEIYADRSPDHWRNADGTPRIATNPLDFDSLAREPGVAAPGWSEAPAGSVIGHVHLRVGDIKAAEEWWNGEMGFDTIAKYGEQAVFLSTGGYHHHIGANVWRSPGAGRRDKDRTGLAWVELTSDTATGVKSREDPWGTVIRTVPKD